MSTRRPPRSVRNHNPGNLDRTATVWQGEDRSASAQAREPRFCVFVAPEYGFRAMAKTWQTYADKHAANTLTKIITRWAPAAENDTTAYIRAVAQSLAVPADTVLDVRSMAIALPLARAIARHEAGADHWPDETIRAGLSMAGVRA